MRFTRAGFQIAAAIMAFGSTALPAQVDSSSGALRGRIIDARTTQAIPAVVVVLTLGRDTLGRTQSDSGGTFVVRARRAARVVAHFTRVGYRADSTPVDILGTSNQLRVAMTPLGAQTIASLDPTKVVAANGTTEFDRRAAMRSGGVFITEADIEKRQPVRTSDLFHGLLGVSVRDSDGVQQLVSNRGIRSNLTPSSTPKTAGRPVTTLPPARGTAPPSAPSSGTDDAPRGPSVDGRKCVLRIGVDGQLMDRSFSIDAIPVSAVRGIEAYLGPATIPVEFSSPGPDAPCGIVMVWTRTGRPSGA
jgi:hypothetical protein